MPYILHYIETKGPREYIVITDEDDSKEIREENNRPGFQFRSSYELDDTGTLPTERCLFPD